MHHRLWRHCSTLLLVIFTLSLIPPQALAAQDIQDAAQRFAQQRASIAGRRDLPVASSGTTAPPASAPAVDQTQRLAQLQQRWAQEQTRDLPPPHAALPVTPSSVYLPGVVQQATPVLAETTASVELPAYRDAHSNVYMYLDGHWETHVYAEPVNYRQPDGSWVPFRPLLRPTIGARAGSTAGYEPDGTNLDVQFAAPTAAVGIAATSSLVHLRQGELQIGFTPRDATLTNASVQGAAIIYADAFPHADLRYTVTGPSIKEEVIFAQAPAADFALIFDLRVQGGRLRQQGQAVVVLDGEGHPQFEIAAPFLVDANGVISTQVQVELQPGNAGTPTLRYTPDPAWLTDPARAYPVILDPTIGPITPAGDTYVAENPPANADHHFEAALFLGYATAGINPIKGRSRFFMNFSLPALPSGVVAADIDSATLSLYQYWDERGGSYGVELYPTNDPWNEAGIRWGTQPGR
ncbi:MAG: DNRLRE domain-containing protein, partial [Chloroflexi bacterium]|nr:DNRLRE domain-containing protein [Chloroflexota bacterium]